MSEKINFICELEQENERLLAQLIELKRIVKEGQKSREELLNEKLEREKQIEELTHLNKTSERVIKHLRERAEDSSKEVKLLQAELEKVLKTPDDDKRKALQYQSQLKESQNQIAKLLEMAQSKENELQILRRHQAPPLTEQLQAQLKETEQELKAAQIHLAKKVKETSELTELNEQHLREIARLEAEVEKRKPPEKPVLSGYYKQSLFE